MIELCSSVEFALTLPLRDAIMPAVRMYLLDL